MSNVIGFLESVGCDAALAGAGREELEIALNEAQIEPALRAAILAGDRSRIEAMLECNSNVCCGIFPGKEDEEEEEEEEPSKEDDEITARSSRAA